MRIVITVQMTVTIDIQDDEQNHANAPDLQSTAECEHCGWRRIYSSPVSAKRARAAHMRFCKGSGSSMKQAFDQLMPK